MKTRDEILSVLNLGWECSRRAWRLLSPEYRDSFSLQQIGTSGRDLDQLAYDLRRQGFNKPARMAYSIAFVLNGLVSKNIAFEHDLADKTSQIVAVMAEMLLELEANQEITTEEPAEIVEHLKVEWGLVLYAEDSSAKLPKPHFRPSLSGRKPPSEQVLKGLMSDSDQLIHAMESLMLRIQNIGDFPYLPAYSRIHHLATLVRTRIVGLVNYDMEPNDERDFERAASAHSVASRSMSAYATAATTGNESSGNVAVAEQPASIAIPSHEREMSVEQRPRRHDHSAQVLVIDESPFFRMLLTSAIEAIGHSIHAIASLEEAVNTCSELPWSMVVCSGAAIQQNLDQLSDWLAASAAETAKIVFLNSSADEVKTSNPRVIQMRRTDISGLMSIMTKELGVASRGSRRSA